MSAEEHNIKIDEIFNDINKKFIDTFGKARKEIKEPLNRILLEYENMKMSEKKNIREFINTKIIKILENGYSTFKKIVELPKLNKKLFDIGIDKTEDKRLEQIEKIDEYFEEVSRPIMGLLASIYMKRIDEDEDEPEQYFEEVSTQQKKKLQIEALHDDLLLAFLDKDIVKLLKIKEKLTPEDYNSFYEEGKRVFPEEEKIIERKMKRLKKDTIKDLKNIIREYKKIQCNRKIKDMKTNKDKEKLRKHNDKYCKPFVINANKKRLIKMVNKIDELDN